MIKVIGARVVVREEKPEETTSGGIVLPDQAKEKTHLGTVIAVGNGIYDSKGNLHPVNISVGDKVIFAKFAGVSIKHDQEEYIIINERDILAIVG